MLFQLFCIAIVGIDHVLPLGILLEDHIGVQHSAELPKEMERVVLQVFWEHEYHNHQGPICQLFGHIVSTVQTIPLALCVVATLVTVAIAEVVLTVLVIQGVALDLHFLAIKAIEQAAGIVALAITAAVIEILPALQGLGAVLPGVIEIKGTVSTIPATSMVITLAIADLITSVLPALRNLTFLFKFRWGDVSPHPTQETIVQDVAQKPIEVGRAVALVEGALGDELARSLVVAGVGEARATHWVLALRAREGPHAQALRALLARDAGAPIPAVQATTGTGIILTRGTFKARGAVADEATSSVGCHSTGPTILARLALTAIDD